MASQHPQFEFTFERPLDLYSASDIYASLDQSLLEKLKEDKRIERKPPSVQPRSLDYCFSMWANTKPDGGLIVVGQEDDGPIRGCTSVSTERMNELERASVVYCPDAKYSSKRIPVINANGKQDYVLVFHVHYRPDRVVRTVGNDAFVRVGSSKKKLSETEARELEIDKGQVDYEQEAVDLSYPRDFDMSLIGQFVQNVHKTYRLTQPHSDTEVLEFRHLGKSTKINFARTLRAHCCLQKIRVLCSQAARFVSCDSRENMKAGEKSGLQSKT